MIVQSSCPVDGQVQMRPEQVLIDEENVVYRFFCPVCEEVVKKPMDANIYVLLRSAGVPSVEEVVLSERVELNDDEDIWRGILSS